MPEIWDGGTPSPTESLPASGGESELSAIGIGAYWFPTTDYRVDVGFLGSLPLSPPTKSKPVTPWDLNNRSSLAHSAGRSVDRATTPAVRGRGSRWSSRRRTPPSRRAPAARRSGPAT